jgi:hypothetical protein
MPRTLVQDREETLRTKSGVNGYHPALSVRGSSAKNHPIGRDEIINLLWVVLWAAIVVAAVAMATGTIAMLVRSVMTIFGYQ